MSEHSAPVRLAALIAVSLAAGVLFVVAPGALAGERAHDSASLAASARVGILGFLDRGVAALPADVADLVDYWQRYHLVKATFAGIALIASVSIVVLLWRRSARPPVIAGVAVASVFAVVAGVLLMANIQGASAPLASVLSLLPQDPRVAVTAMDVRARLDAGPGALTPPLMVLVDDFAWYHLVLAVLAGVATLLAVVATVVVWRRSRPLALIPVLAAAATAVLVVANAGTAADPIPALSMFFAGY